MIKQYLDYKKKKVEEILSSPLVAAAEKNKVIAEYNQFIAEAFSDEFPGMIILNKRMVLEMTMLAKDGKIPLVMDMYDTMIVSGIDMPNGNGNKRPFKKIADLVAVHKSGIPPQGDKILTSESSGAEGIIYFVDPKTGKEHYVSYPCGSDTIHFTLNCVVKNHESGNDWDNYKYAVMIGLDKLDKTKILDVKSEDTYVDGDAELGDDYIIFCPLGEREEVQENNPNAMVIEYDGIPLNMAIESMIVYSGRKLEPYGTYGWGRKIDFMAPMNDNEQLDELLAEKDYPNLRGVFGALLHSESKYMARRMWKREYEAIIALVEYNKANNIDMPVDRLVMGLAVSGAYAIPGNLMVSVKDYKEFVLPILEKHGYVVGEELFEGIDPEASGIKSVSHFYDENGRELPDVECPDWENELRSRVINIIMGNQKVDTTGDSPKSGGKK